MKETVERSGDENEGTEGKERAWERGRQRGREGGRSKNDGRETLDIL